MAQEQRNEAVARQWTQSVPVVAAYIRSMTASFHDAQDILQEVSVAVVRKYDQYDPARPFIPWAIGIARNEVLAYRRHAAVERRVLDDDAFALVSEAFGQNLPQSDDLLEALTHCVNQSPDRSRNLLRLRYLEDMSYEQIAGRVRASVNSVKVAMHRLRQALRGCIEEQLSKKGAS